ncbi:MAG TPA: serine hydrolase, partial [Pilimelia sp.]|nr:serine hydrolase [Pilimelia sp.]
EPTAHPHRFFLGRTTARETHDLLWRLASGALLSPGSTEFLLRVLRAPGGYHDGVRRDMSSAERARVATKHAADFDDTGAARHEAGVVFAADGTPALGYAFFADGLGDRHDYGGTHPAVRAHAALGRAMLDALGG